MIFGSIYKIGPANTILYVNNTHLINFLKEGKWYQKIQHVDRCSHNNINLQIPFSRCYFKWGSKVSAGMPAIQARKRTLDATNILCRSGFYTRRNRGNSKNHFVMGTNTLYDIFT
jgi:hypothetical protein